MTDNEYRQAARREMGVIHSVRYGRDPDHCCVSCDVIVGFDGSTQGMCVILDDKLGPDFVRQLCRVFGVKEIDDLVNRPCYALRCWGFHNDDIEGLESIDTGNRFVLTSWNMQHFADTKSPAIRRRRQLVSEMISFEARIDRCRQDLETLLDGYVDWSDTAP